MKIIEIISPSEHPTRKDHFNVKVEKNGISWFTQLPKKEILKIKKLNSDV